MHVGVSACVCYVCPCMHACLCVNTCEFKYTCVLYMPMNAYKLCVQRICACMCTYVGYIYAPAYIHADMYVYMCAGVHFHGRDES